MGGGGHNYYSLALRLLDYMGFATEASTELKMGGTHSSQRALGLGISAPYQLQISEFFVWDREGAQKCFILHDQTTGDLTFTSPGHTHSPVCAPTASFSFSRVVMWVICYHINNLSLLCIMVYWYIVTISYFA